LKSLEHSKRYEKEHNVFCNLLRWAERIGAFVAAEQRPPVTKADEGLLAAARRWLGIDCPVRPSRPAGFLAALCRNFVLLT
jgi:hypothetical protein